METTTYEVGGMSCQGCVSNLTSALQTVEGVTEVEVEVGSAVIHHEGVATTTLNGAITDAGFSPSLVAPVANGGAVNESDFNWGDRAVWKQSAHNTKWCLVGCSIGDFGTIAFFQFFLPDTDWTTMHIMLLAMFNGLMTSIALETFILTKQMALVAAFRTACGMSLISMISMEAAMNIVDVLITGGAMLAWYTLPPMLLAGFLTPWPYNYWRLKKYDKACC
jgi:copper chaperone CopZ